MRRLEASGRQQHFKRGPISTSATYKPADQCRWFPVTERRCTSVLMLSVWPNKQSAMNCPPAKSLILDVAGLGKNRQ